MNRYDDAYVIERVPTGYVVDVCNCAIWHPRSGGMVCKLDFDYDVARQHVWTTTKYNNMYIKGTLQEVVDKVCAMHRIGVTNNGSS